MTGPGVRSRGASLPERLRIDATRLWCTLVTEMAARGFLRLVLVLACLGASLRPAVAHAETPAERNLARKLAGEALDLFKAADYAAALLKFSKADGLVSAPTLKVRIARCLDKLGRMHEAAGRYREVIALELKPYSPSVHVEARSEAVAELAKLNVAMPRLTVLLSGSLHAGAVVSVDGEPLGSALGQEQLLDPGFHSVSVAVGTRHIDKGVTLERGKSEKLLLGVPPGALDGSDEGLGDGDSGGHSDAVSTPTLRTAGWALAGVGGAGLVVGVVGTALLYRDRATLAIQCPTGTCFSDDAAGVELADRYNRERVVASVGWIGGGILGAVGASMLVVASLRTSPSGSSETSQTTIVPVVSPEFIGVFGRF